MPESRSSRHLWEIDLIRLLTFTAVISVHALAFTQQPANQVAAAFMMLLQFGREVFFAITGFVLVYSSIGKEVRPLAFWRRRIPFVAVPYVIWTLIYYVVTVTTSAHGAWSGPTLVRDLKYGAASYHLYFLVVTLQVYLVFPYLVRFLRATASRAVAVLVMVGVANLAWFGLLEYGHFNGWIWARGYELLPTYSVYVLAGGYAALHREKIQTLLVAHRARLLAIAAGAAVVALGAYTWQLGWMLPRNANSVTQPAMFASCVAAIAVLAVLGQQWVARGTPGRRAVAIGSEISFGVYLAHPLVLSFLLDHGLGNGHQVVPSPLATVLALFGAIAGASLLSLAVRGTPLALFLIGRPRAGSRSTLAAARGGTAVGETPSRVGVLSEVSGGTNRPLISPG